MEACSVSGRIKCHGVPLGQAVPLALKCPNPFASSFAVGGMSPYAPLDNQAAGVLGFSGKADIGVLSLQHECQPIGKLARHNVEGQGLPAGAGSSFSASRPRDPPACAVRAAPPWRSSSPWQPASPRLLLLSQSPLALPCTEHNSLSTQEVTLGSAVSYSLLCPLHVQHALRCGPESLGMGLGYTKARW